MDVWQSADPQRKAGTGWIGRSVPDLQDRKGNIPVMQVGPNRLPLALQGGPGGVVSIDGEQSYKLELGETDAAKQKARRKLLEDLAQPDKTPGGNDLLQFVQRRQLQTYTTLDRVQAALLPSTKDVDQLAAGSDHLRSKAWPDRQSDQRSWAPAFTT